MDIVQYEDMKRMLLHAFNIAAPNGLVQRNMVNSLHRMELNGADHNDVLLMIADGLVVGLRHGHWKGVDAYDC